METPVKILLIDIETAPSLGWVWQKYDANVIDFKSNWYVLSYAYKWLGDTEVQTKGLIDFPGYKRDRENDKQLMKSLWKLMDEADVIVAHNGNSFDLPKINTRFLTHGMQPPTPYQTVDTLKIARKVFAFESNKLDDLGRYLGVGRKLPNTGFHLWRGCMEGDPGSWEKMKEYNAHDVELLEKVYFIVRAWDKNHPLVNRGEIENCPKCGANKVQRRGFEYTLLRKKQRYQCRTCHGWYCGSAQKV